MLQKLVFDYSGERGIAFRFRQKRAEQIRHVILSLGKGDADIDVLDVGGTEIYWKAVGYDWLRENGVKIVVLNRSIQATKLSSVNRDIFTPAVGDACDLPYRDSEFDLCFSNSVIEHVGDFSRMCSFASEARRVARCYYCQTPNFWFPIEPHFLFPGFHYLPEPIRVSLLRRFDLGHYKKARDIVDAYAVIQSAQLIGGRAMAKLFDDADIHRERFLFVFTKSLVAIKKEMRIAKTLVTESRPVPEGAEASSMEAGVAEHS